jgi:hypothetical protein
MIRHYVFPGVGSSGATSCCLHRTRPLTQLLRRYAPTLRRIIRCWSPHNQNVSGSFHVTVGWTAADPSVHPVLKGSCWCVSVLFKHLTQLWKGPVVAQCTRCSDAMHRWYRRFIRWCLFPSFSSRPQLGSLLQLNILNMPSLIASKYILSPHFCYKWPNMSMVC